MGDFLAMDVPEGSARATRRPRVHSSGSGEGGTNALRAAARGATAGYQPEVPRSPLKGPTTSDVIQPP